MKITPSPVKFKNFKVLWYLLSSGAAATTVLLTVSSVGLRKSLSDTFPNLDGLIKDRPEVAEDLLKPTEPPKPQPPPPSLPDGEAGQNTPSSPSSGDQGSSSAEPQSQQGPQAGGAVSGSPQGATSSTLGGGATCDTQDLAGTIQNLSLMANGLLSSLTHVGDQTNSIGDCIHKLKDAVSPSQGTP